ncbi:hypothetical protein Pcar_3200 [Syntrophotalea carbinolica DSM 2380]|uniref:Uncharacterized protein n=1 Tax=Syntrophotalea carbinolica (strain DSM 2380 / NBRC 103641 / GraBd1) TaxID=338963 RepID=Q0C6W7_SYNC1|nr:hypothetical protein Pcar_3200 [Syntrophotalea carbinolica DSM 2380]
MTCHIQTYTNPGVKIFFLHFNRKPTSIPFCLVGSKVRFLCLRPRPERPRTAADVPRVGLPFSYEAYRSARLPRSPPFSWTAGNRTKPGPHHGLSHQQRRP